MEYLVSDRTLNARLKRDFNLLTTRQIERFADQVDTIVIDLSHAKIVDSEAIMLLYRLLKAGKRVRLRHPPAIMGEALAILGLEDIIRLDELTEPAGTG